MFSFSFHCSSNGRRQQSFDLLGSHTLADLQQCIYCLHYQLLGDSQLPDPGFFFIEGLFYVDMSCSHSPQGAVMRADVEMCRALLFQGDKDAQNCQNYCCCTIPAGLSTHSAPSGTTIRLTTSALGNNPQDESSTGFGFDRGKHNHTMIAASACTADEQTRCMSEEIAPYENDDSDDTESNTQREERDQGTLEILAWLTQKREGPTTTHRAVAEARQLCSAALATSPTVAAILRGCQLAEGGNVDQARALVLQHLHTAAPAGDRKSVV